MMKLFLSTFLIVALAFLVVFASAFDPRDPSQLPALIDSTNLDLAFALLDQEDIMPTDLVDRDELFSMDELKRSARFSSISRCLTYNKKSVREWTCSWCKKYVPGLTDVIIGESQKSEVAWFVGYSRDDNQVVVSARSSLTIANWLYDLDFAGSSFSGCSDCFVHTGFMKSYLELRPNWLEAYYTIHSKHSNPSIRIQGHSLAAAIATHAAVDISTGIFTRVELNGNIIWHSTSTPSYNTMSADVFQQFLIDSKSKGATIKQGIKFNLITPFFNFGSPRVGNTRFVRFFQHYVGEKGLIRSTHANDPVCRVPFKNTLGHKYQHVSQEIFFPGSDNKFKVCDDVLDEDKKCALGNLLPVVITDHLFYAGIGMMQLPTDCT